MTRGTFDGPRNPDSKPARRVQAVARRDGWFCHYCGRPLSLMGSSRIGPVPKDWGFSGAVAATIDHFTPRILGGNSQMPNLRLADSRCNSRKGSMRGEAFLALMSQPPTGAEPRPNLVPDYRQKIIDPQPHRRPRRRKWDALHGCWADEYNQRSVML